MSVLEFAFDPDSDNDYLPHNIHEDSICYMGTHDNHTVRGWVESLDEETLNFAKDYMHITEEEGWCWGMIRTGMATPACLFVVQMQDLLELDGSARMNTPGQAAGNWQWRMQEDALTDALAERLYQCTALYRRLPQEEVDKIKAAKAAAKKAEEEAAEKAKKETEEETVEEA